MASSTGPGDARSTIAGRSRTAARHAHDPCRGEDDRGPADRGPGCVPGPPGGVGRAPGGQSRGLLLPDVGVALRLVDAPRWRPEALPPRRPSGRPARRHRPPESARPPGGRRPAAPFGRVSGCRSAQLGLPGRDRQARLGGRRDSGTRPVSRRRAARARAGQRQTGRLCRRRALSSAHPASMADVGDPDRRLPVHRFVGTHLGVLPRDTRVEAAQRLLETAQNLTKKFSVRLEPASSEPQRREFMVHLVRLHNLRWQNLGGSDALHTADLVAFHDEVSRVTLERGWLRLFVLWLDGQPVASLYGFRYGRTFYFVQTGFDPAYGRHAVGLITVGLTIKSAIAEGAEEYDFLRGDEAYKFRWAREVRHLATLEVYPRGAPELLYRRTQRLTAVAKRIARQTLPRTVIDRVIAARQRRFQILASR